MTVRGLRGCESLGGTSDCAAVSSEWRPDFARIQGKVPQAIADQIEEAIRAGILRTGDRLPTQSALADELGFHLNTINAAFREAAHRGLIECHARRGTFVSEEVMLNRSYSTNKEDLFIRTWMDRWGVKEGFYVDVGSGPPVLTSNTYALYERGFSGICVEPQLQHVLHHREIRPRDMVVPAVAGAAFGVTTLWLLQHEQLATVSEQMVSYWAAKNSKPRGRLDVLVVPLNALLDRHQPQEIHFLSVDVEGAEQNVFQGLDLTRYRPWIMCVEATMPLSTVLSRQEWMPYVLDHGYQEVLFDGCNRFFVATEHIK
jgi:FkbM family methyltransferase